MLLFLCDNVWINENGHYIYGLLWVKRREDSKEKVSCIQFLPLGLMASADAWCYTCVYRIQPRVRGLGIGEKSC